MDFFKILLHDGANFSNKSLALKEYDTPAESIELTTAGALYIGLYKEFNTFFIELVTKSVASAKLTAEYYDGTAWQSLEISDETNGLKNSGFIFFEGPNNFSKVTVDGIESYFIRIKTDIDTGAVTCKLIDILFSSDKDLIKIRENIISKLSTNGTWAAKHIAARDHIIQEIRNKGNVKAIPVDNGFLPEIIYKDITKFDFLEPLQLRMAATYLALYFIFWYELSDEEGDKWQLKAAEMYRLYEYSMQTFYLVLDLNDDGKKDSSDVAAKSEAIRTIVLG
jgi:hypothetical protein